MHNAWDIFEAVFAGMGVVFVIAVICEVISKTIKAYSYYVDIKDFSPPNLKLDLEFIRRRLTELEKKGQENGTTSNSQR